MRNRNPLILVADDDEQIRDRLEKCLKESYRILLAHNGQHAKNLFQQHGRRIAAVVTDAEMPIVDGVALTSWLQGQPNPPPVILMSGHDSQNAKVAKELWHDTPGIAWLEKPFEMQDLREAVNTAVRDNKCD